MKEVHLSRVCLQCDGRIEHDATSCPYCGEKSISGKQSILSTPEAQSSVDTPPPYTSSFDEFSLLNEQVKAYSQTNKEPITENSNDTQETKSTEAIDIAFLCTFALFANIAALGLFVMLFSTNGFVRLAFSSKYAFVYTLFALGACAFIYTKYKDKV